MTLPMASTRCSRRSTTAARASSLTARVSQAEGAQRDAAEHQVGIGPGQLGPGEADALPPRHEPLELVGLQLRAAVGGVAELGAVAELERAAGHERSGPAGLKGAHPLLVAVVERPAAAAPVAPPSEERSARQPRERHVVVLVRL